MNERRAALSCEEGKESAGHRMARQLHSWPEPAPGPAPLTNPSERDDTVWDSFEAAFAPTREGPNLLFREKNATVFSF